MSVRHQDIVDAIETRMKTIKKTAGYFTDAGDNVDVWREIPLDPGSATPFEHVNIKDMPETVDSQGESGPIGCWNRELMVQIVLTAGSVELVGQMARDVTKAAGTDDTWGDEAILTDIDPGKAEGVHDEKKIASQTLTLSIQYRTGPGSPDDTPLAVGSTTPADPPSADKTTAIAERMEAQIAAAFAAGDSWFWRMLPFGTSELPAIDVKTDQETIPAEATSGDKDIETKILPVKSTILYTGKGNLATLRAEKEAVLTAIQKDPQLGGLALDCIPRVCEWSMDQEETAIIGITVTHEVLYQTDKWEN